MENVDFVKKMPFKKKPFGGGEDPSQSNQNTTRGRWLFRLLIVVTPTSAQASWGVAKSLSCRPLLLLRKRGQDLIKAHPLQHPDCS